jgi:protein TonB
LDVRYASQAATPVENGKAPASSQQVVALHPLPPPSMLASVLPELEPEPEPDPELEVEPEPLPLPELLPETPELPPLVPPLLPPVVSSPASAPPLLLVLEELEQAFVPTVPMPPITNRHAKKASFFIVVTNLPV